MIIVALVSVLIGVIVLVVILYNKEFEPQFYKTPPSQIKSVHKAWTSDGETPIETEQCLVWDSSTQGMYYQECDSETDKEHEFSMFYTDKAKTKPHGFGVMKGGRYYCFGPTEDNVTITKKECDSDDLYQKFRYDSEEQRLEYQGPNVKSTMSQTIVPQSFQTNNKAIIWDAYLNDTKGNQVFI